ncbi:MAG: hypothetical protein JWQ26_3300 [Modestobacter sp.]|nr:hypothetical protein [Modestobacter sp.]
MTAPALAAIDAPARLPAAPSPWRWAAALGVLGAGALHIAAAVEHLSTGDLVVGFFLLTALTQLGAGVWLLLGSWLGIRPGGVPLAAALAGTVLLVCLYLVAHTTDLLAGLTASEAGHGAAGHHAGAAVEAEGPVALGDQAPVDPEPPDLLGTATVGLELLSVLALTALLPRARRGRTLNALLALGALAWVAWLTGVLG